MLIDNLAFRANRRKQLTTDDLNAYLQAVEGRLGADVDNAMLHKLYDALDGRDNEQRYSPAPSASEPTPGSSPATRTLAT